MIIGAARKLHLLLVLLAAALGGTMMAHAQEEVLRQTNEGQGVYWVPIVSAFYAQPEQGRPTWPEDDGPPIFPEGVINPPLHFTLNPSPVDSVPTIDTDWVVLQKRMQNDEHASAWVVAREFGKPRIWLHRTFNEDYLAGYPESNRVYVRTELDVIRESFPIPGEFSKPARKQLIQDKVRIVSGKMQIFEINGVRKNGSGGNRADNPLAAASLGEDSIGGFNQRGPLEFVPRGETRANGDLLDGVIGVSIELELEAGAELGLNTPERKKLVGEIRFAVGEQYISIMKVSGGGQKK